MIRYLEDLVDEQVKEVRTRAEKRRREVEQERRDLLAEAELCKRSETEEEDDFLSHILVVI